MAIYFNKSSEGIEISKQKLELLAKHYKQIANVLVSNEVQEVLKKWQGKQYNKRLETALKKIDSHFYIDNRFNCYLEYNFYNNNERSIKVEVVNKRNEKEKRNIYQDKYKHRIQLLTESSILKSRNTIREDIASQIIECAKYYQLQYEELNNQLFLLDNILKEYKELTEKINVFTNNIQPDIRAEFGMYIINQY